MNEIRIAIVDDHNLFRESLGRLLDGTPHLHVVAQCATLAEALDLLPRVQADVILLDYDLGIETGGRLVTELQQLNVPSKVLMVTAGLSDEATLRVMEAGAAGIFLKHSSPDLLITAIQQVVEGEVWLDNVALQKLLAGRRERSEAPERTRPLTARQMEVLRGILDGLANKEIAWKLKISETSVKAVIQELFHKAGVRTRSQLVRIAIENHSFDWLAPAERR